MYNTNKENSICESGISYLPFLSNFHLFHLSLCLTVLLPLEIFRIPKLSLFSPSFLSAPLIRIFPNLKVGSLSIGISFPLVSHSRTFFHVPRSGPKPSVCFFFTHEFFPISRQIFSILPLFSLFSVSFSSSFPYLRIFSWPEVGSLFPPYFSIFFFSFSFLHRNFFKS